MHSRGRTSSIALALVLAFFSWPGPIASAQSVEPLLEQAPPDPEVTTDPSDDGLGRSDVAADLAVWVAATNDNDDLPFMIVDKLAAKVFAFDAAGRLLGSAPVLVGLARGDDSAPGIGNLQLLAISPDERTTPAGRFVARFGPSAGHGTVFWVDYADAISMHPVITTNPREHRLRRIKSAAPEDHRISYGCINVPAKFYVDVVRKAFGGGGVVYVLPDTKPLRDVFPGFAAVEGAAVESIASRQSRCADPLLDVPDDFAGAKPSPICPPEDRKPMDAPPIP